MSHTQTRRCEFDKRTRLKIIERDRGCIFCRANYHMEDTDSFGRECFEIMHYVARSHGGLGIEQNGALGCKSHHAMLDNGNKGRREEMLAIFREHLKRFYKSWNEEDLVYSKWKSISNL